MLASVPTLSAASLSTGVLVALSSTMTFALMNIATVFFMDTPRYVSVVYMVMFTSVFASIVSSQVQRGEDQIHGFLLSFIAIASVLTAAKGVAAFFKAPPQKTSE